MPKAQNIQIIRFSVKGYPQPKGSMRAFIPKGWRRPILTTDNKRLKDWATLVRIIAQRHAPKKGLWDGPVELNLNFRLKKPKSLPKKRRSWPIKKPDIDKLIRAISDALTGVIFTDDARIVSVHVWKDYGDSPGVDIEVLRIL